MELLVGESKESLLCFNLTGEEHVDSSPATCKKHGDACLLGRIVCMQRAGGATPLGLRRHADSRYGVFRYFCGRARHFQLSCEPTVLPVMHNINVGVCTLLTEQEAEVLQGTRGQIAMSQPVSNADIYSAASQLD